MGMCDGGRLQPSQPYFSTQSHLLVLPAVRPFLQRPVAGRGSWYVVGSVNCVSGVVLDMLPDTMFPATLE